MTLLAIAPGLLLLAGAAATTVPVALHFFYRARYRRLPWAPMKFLKEAIEQTSRRLRFQELILLLIRCVALLLLALGLALGQQAWDSTTDSGGSGQPVDAVFVFDTSYSMAAKDGDKSRLDRAKETAISIIDSLPDKSSIQIYACSDRSTPLGPVSSSNRDQAKQIVQALEVTSLSTDLLPGLTDALAASQTGTAATKEIYVFSDMQKTGFTRQQGAIRAKCEEIKGKANLIFIRCGNPERTVANVSVLDVQLLAAIPHTKTRVPFKVTLKNTGREPIRAVKVALELDGKAIEKDALQIDQIDAGATATVTLTGSLDEAGTRLLSVHAEGDGLPGDNVLYRVINVRDKVRVLLVALPHDRTKNQSETESADWYARKALVPFDTEKDKEKIKNYFIETESVSPNEVGPDKLANKDVVYLLNAAARTDNPLQGMSPAFIARLAEFVKKGGGLVIGGGDAVNKDAYNRAFGKDGAGLLPMQLGDVQNATAVAPFVPSAESIEESSVLGEIKPYTKWIADATVEKMFALDEAPASATGARVLMRTTDNKPLVASREVGKGEVIFFATTLDETWGRLMSFGQLAIPMTTHLIAHLTARKVPGGTRTAGDVLTWHPPKQEAAFELIKPKPPADKPGDKTRPRVSLGEAKELCEITEPALKGMQTDQVPDTVVEKLRPALGVEFPKPDFEKKLGELLTEDEKKAHGSAIFERAKTGRYVVSTGAALAAGEYAIVPIGAADPIGLTSETGITFVVNPDLRETDNLDMALDKEMSEVLGYTPTIIPAGTDTASIVRERRTRSGWTEYVLLALVLLLVCEAGWAWYCGTAK